MRLSDAPRQVQTQAQSLGTGPTRETVEQRRQEVRRDARPLIAHAQHRPVAVLASLLLNLNGDGRPLRRVLERVADQVLQCLP